MSDLVKAPWTCDQVSALNSWQERGDVHPFTCGGENCREVLIADHEGWHCPACDYTQNWAHRFMTNPRPSPAVVASLPAQEEKPIRIWAAHCAFRKDGFPSLGNFGKSVAPVVILPMETWTRLCREIPELGRRQFEVGTQD